MTITRIRSGPRWERWFRFTDAHQAVPTVVTVAGLAVIMFLLVPGVAHPSGHGSVVDTLSTLVKSDTLTAKAVTLRAVYHQSVPSDVRDYAGNLFFTPALYFLVPFVLLLEFLFPVNPSQPLVGKGFWQDAVWFVATAPTKVLVLGAVSELLRHVYDNHLAFLTIGFATAWPLYLQVVAALVMGEFFNWVSHFVRHKVRALWLFHAVHHSQKELNVFTDDRQHVVDRLAAVTVMFVPFYMFQVPNLYAVAVIGLCVSSYSRFVHANAKINLGWLGWVLSSPQFHRVHHSAEPEHWDTNFGGVISVFDHLFGTACPSSTVYPETGISDPSFPDEDKVPVSRLFGNWVTQTLHPFQQVFDWALAVRPRNVLRLHIRPLLTGRRSGHV